MILPCVQLRSPGPALPSVHQNSCVAILFFPPQVTDFCMARIMGSTAGRDPRWLAPEVLAGGADSSAAVSETCRLQLVFGSLWKALMGRAHRCAPWHWE